MNENLQREYEDLLSSYISEPKENHLYGAQRLSKWIMEQKIPPEEIVSFHFHILKKLFPELPPELKSSFDFLLEVMVGYGVQYQDTENIVNRQKELQYELEVAAGMQQTLLPSPPTPLPGMEIGVWSAAAKQMSGDYYNFVHYENSLGIAIADIIGKGIPAALCMSMIKYSMDRMEQPLSPSEVLRGLNTVVERNVDPSMFITMIYGVYDSSKHCFRFASAGHEPGLFYQASEDKFTELEAKGLVLGVSREAEYEEKEISLQEGDAIILFSDGVTECKVNGEFLKREQLIELIRANLHLPAQQAVQAIYEKLLEMTGYHLQDDQTTLIIKRVSG